MEQTCENTTTVFLHLKKEKNKEDMFQQNKMIDLYVFYFKIFSFVGSQGKVINNESMYMVRRKILQAALCLLVIGICLKGHGCFFHFPLPILLSWQFAVEPSIHLMWQMSKWIKSLCLGAENGNNSSALSKEALCLNLSWNFSFQIRTAFAWKEQYPAAYTLPGEGEHDIRHKWGVTFSFHGTSTSLTADSRIVAMLFRKTSFWCISAFSLSIDFWGSKRNLAQVLMSDDNICQARYYSGIVWSMIWQKVSVNKDSLNTYFAH